MALDAPLLKAALRVENSMRKVLMTAFLFGAAGVAFVLLSGRQGPAQGSPPTPARDTSKAPGAPAAPKQASPKLVVNPVSHDVGKQKEGEKVRRTFVLQNEGGAPLAITGIVPRCGSCLTVEIKRREIPPGESEDLIVEYTLTDWMGKFVRYIVVESNDSGNNSVSLMLQGETVAEFEVVPPKISFGEVRVNASHTERLKLKRNFGGSLEIAGLGQVAPGLKVGLPDRRTVPEGETVEVPVTLEPRPTPGNYKGNLVLRVNGKLHKELSIPVTAKIVSPIRLAEEDIFFGIVPATESATRTVTVALDEGVDPGSVRVRCDADWVRAEFRKGDGAGGPSVKVDLLPTDKTGAFSAKVRLEASVAGAEVTSEAVCYGIRTK